ncbi:hypothetical protein TSOC_012246 [Tetrabaena socialis]|uniref:Neurochondrin n=1 Tax=Tetrabaena socialis TaxID=47790 RepID=A0A2J7ZNJ7_9CHLO|nr:hypothetical protein TSOC_012246 [Tetrabaena socialis]|eukprot:PNH01843.1 hypothetical protein TSOC_012246 [Tetrabaena socialis]
MALPDALGDAAMRLPALAARHVGVPGSGPPLDAGEAGQLAGMLLVVAGAFKIDDDSAIVDALLSDNRLRLALLRLVAFAVRDSHQSGPAFRNVAVSALEASASLLWLQTPTAWRARALLDFGRKLLRMDTLQCCSSVFAESAAAVEVIAAGGAAGAEAGPADAAAAAAVDEAAPQALQGHPAVGGVRIGLCVLMRNMLRLPAGPVCALGAECSARQRLQVEEQRQQFSRELAAALRDSRVLEHGARWALHAQLAVSAGWEAEVGRFDAFSYVVMQVWHASQLALAMEDDSVAAPALREVLSGPCVRHAVLSLGLAALCVADGGPSHGLPEELLFHLPILGRAGEDLRGLHGRQQLDCTVFVCVVWVLQGCPVASATPLRDWRSGVALLRRIGSLLLTSARVWADEAAVAEVGPQPSALQLALCPTDLTLRVAVPMLARLRWLVRDQKAAAAGAPAALAEAEAAWWPLVVDIVTHCVQWADASDLPELAELLSPVWGPLPTDGA